MTDQPQVPAEQPNESPAQSLEAAQIAAYLEAHPDFFVEHEELLPALRIPHRRGDTVSLVERQMKILRERNIEMRHRLSQLMDVARDNDRLFEKTRRLILALMDAASLDDLVMAVEDSLRQDFQVPATWVETASRDTWENATDSAAILRPLGIHSVYVVTHAWHMNSGSILDSLISSGQRSPLTAVP